MRVYAWCAIFLLGTLGLLGGLEFAAKNKSLREADRFVSALDAGLADQKLVTLVVGDELDDDSEFSTDRSWPGAARVVLERLRGRGPAAPALGASPPGLIFDWRTQTLAWAGDREKQYDALNRALASARARGARVQLIARGRGGDVVLQALRRAASAPPDRLLVVGLAPAAGDERLAAHVAFFYPSSGGAVLAYADDGAPFMRAAGPPASELRQNAEEAFETERPFRGTNFNEPWPEGGPAQLEGLSLAQVPAGLPRSARRALTLARGAIARKWADFLRERNAFYLEFKGTTESEAARAREAKRLKKELTRRADLIVDEADSYDDLVRENQRKYRPARRF